MLQSTKTFVVKSLSGSIITTLSSIYFFIAIIILFLLQAGWIATTASFPLPFDEKWHLDFIEVYSKQISPFIAAQSTEVHSLGDVTRIGSYLFHYLLSYPDRLLSILDISYQSKIVALRFLNILFVALGVVIYRKFLIRLNFSLPIVHSGILVLISMPLFIYTAAHINYDNLLFLVVALFLYLSVLIYKNNKLNFQHISLWLTVGMLGSLVKFSFLVIFATAFLCLTIFHWKNQKDLKNKIRNSFRKTSTPAKIFLVSIVLISGGLFCERYGGNIVKYYSINPRCEKVQSLEVCSRNDVWARDKAYSDSMSRIDPIKRATMTASVVSYTQQHWLFSMFNGPFKTYPLWEGSKIFPIFHNAVQIAGFLGILLVVYYARRLFQVRARLLVGAIGGFYFFILWLENYSAYVSLGKPVAISARYGLIFLPLVIVLIIQSYSYLLRNKTNLKIGFLIIGVVALTQGGGIVGYFLNYPTEYKGGLRNEVISKIDNRAKSILTPIVKEY